MKVAVMGAGAVGCFYGAMLARAGYHVTLIGRRQHVAAVCERGLILEMGGATHTVAADATTDPKGIADADVILFCVKSDDTAAAGRDMLPYLRPDTVILGLQNGVDNAPRLQAVLQQPVIAAAVYVASDMPAPGHVRHSGRGELVIAAGPRSEAIAEMFQQAGVPTTTSDNVLGVLWAKLIINCCYNALSAIAQMPYGRLIEVEGIRDLMKDVVAECLVVAAGLRVSIPGDSLGTVLGLAASMPNQFSSTAQDLARGKRTEIDHLNGYIIRTARELGIPVPVNRSLTAMIKLMEAKASQAT
jgi:2-dehydropantoate 2-reductase